MNSLAHLEDRRGPKRIRKIKAGFRLADRIREGEASRADIEARLFGNPDKSKPAISLDQIASRFIHPPERMATRIPASHDESGKDRTFPLLRSSDSLGR